MHTSCHENGRRTTFAFTPRMGDFNAYAEWKAAPDVHATLTPLGSDIIDYFPSLHWRDGGDSSTFDNHDVPGWILTTQDGTTNYITRGSANTVTFDPNADGNYIYVQAYGAPKLTSILQRSGDTIAIGDGGVTHYPPNSTNATRSIWFERDLQNRLTAIYDPNSFSISNLLSSISLPVVRYVYNADT